MFDSHPNKMNALGDQGSISDEKNGTWCLLA